MGTGRTMNKAPRTRPKKKERERRRRINEHRTKLAAAGVDEEAIRHMTPGELRAGIREAAKASA